MVEEWVKRVLFFGCAISIAIAGHLLEIYSAVTVVFTLTRSIPVGVRKDGVCSVRIVEK